MSQSGIMRLMLSSGGRATETLTLHNVAAGGGPGEKFCARLVRRFSDEERGKVLKPTPGALL